jgi:hypothetical protein
MFKWEPGKTKEIMQTRMKESTPSGMTIVKEWVALRSSYGLHLALSFLFIVLRNRIHQLQVLPSGAHLTGQDLQQELI